MFPLIPMEEIKRLTIYLLPTLLVLMPFAIYYCYYKPMTYWKRKGVKQNRWPMPIFGDNWKLVLGLRSSADNLIDLYERCPEARYSGFYQFSHPRLLIRDPNLIKQITIKDFEYFTDHLPFVCENSDPVFGRILMSLKGKEWRQMRAMMSFGFTTSKMKYMSTLINDVIKNVQKYLSEQNVDIAEMDIKELYTRFTCDVIASVAFGINVNCVNDKENLFYKMGLEATELSSIAKRVKMFGFNVFPSIFRLLKIPLLGTTPTEYLKHVIIENIEHRRKSNSRRPDMLTILMDAQKARPTVEHEELNEGFTVTRESVSTERSNKQITVDDIVSQGVVFFFAGFESVANLLSFATYELALNPDIQQRLRTEIMETVHDNIDDINYTTLAQMTYLDMVVTETLRKYPTIIQFDRVCTKPYVIPPTLPDEKPVELQVGDVLSIHLMPMHRDPKYFPDPMTFDPDRFSDENKRKIVPFTFIPFGAGPRTCIASRLALLETKLMLVNLVACYEISPTSKTEIPITFCKRTLSLNAANGFWLGLRPL